MFEQRLSLLMAARPTLGFPALAPVVICMYDVYVGVFVTEIIYMCTVHTCIWPQLNKHVAILIACSFASICR